MNISRLNTLNILRLHGELQVRMRKLARIFWLSCSHWVWAIACVSI